MARVLRTIGLFALGISAVQAIELPSSCPAPSATAPTVPLSQLRARLKRINEEDPDAAIALMCTTIPRVAREAGEHSAELAWWVASLATPLIAYKEKFDDAIPLLNFAQPILERQPARYANEIADIHVAFAWIYFRQGRLKEAGDAWEAALAVRERAPGEKQIELQKVLVGLAQVRLAQRDFPAAHAALDRATVILTRNHAAVSEAAAAIENVQTNVALREEDFASARAHAEAQIRIEAQLSGGAPQRIPAYVLLGTIDQRMDDFDAAERSLREAIRLAESEHGPLQRHYLTALNQIALLLIERDRPREALPFAQRALQVGETSLGANAPKLVGVLRTLGECERSLGDLPSALRRYLRAQAIIDAHRADIERQVLVAHYRGLGALERELGDRDAARAALSAGLEAVAEDATLSVEHAHVLLALSATREPANPERKQELESALRLFQSRLPARHPLNLRVVNELCAGEIAVGADTPRCREAQAWIETANDVEPSLRSAVLENSSQLDTQQRDYAGAYQEAIQALAAAEAVGTPQPLWRAYFTLATALQRRDEAALAIFFGKQAVAQIERMRGDFASAEQELQRSFLIDKISVYRTVADWLLAAGRIDEGLQVLRLLKAEELYDFQLRGAPTDAESLPLTGYEEGLKSRYSAALNPAGVSGEELARLALLSESDRLSPAERARLHALVASQGSANDERVRQLSRLLTGDAAAPRAPAARTHAIDAATLRAELDHVGPDGAVAVYLLTADRLRLLIATHREQLSYEAPIDRGVLQRDIGRFLLAMSRQEDIQPASQALYELIARPLDIAAQRAHAKSLSLWLDGSLRYVPFAALYDGHRYLVDKYALQSYALGTAHAAARAPLLQVRGLGVTEAVAGFDALPAIAEELCEVVQGPISGLTAAGKSCRDASMGNGVLPGEGFANGAFTESLLRSILEKPRDFSVLHIGTHFSLRPGNAMRSFLVLGDGSRLDLNAISTLRFSGLDLVTLSACQTALGGSGGDDGREIEALSAIVQRAGAHQVVASLWGVEDRSTALLMRGLYQGLLDFKGDAALALQTAQHNLRALRVGAQHPYDHPFYWAAFVVSTALPTGAEN
jgi:CHAT domain-containing protein